MPKHNRLDRAKIPRTLLGALILCLPVACDTADDGPPDVDADARASVVVPTPGPDGWGEGDELGNGNTQSYGTRLRCATRLADPGAQVYELSHAYSETMPQALFGDGPADFTFNPTGGFPFTRHVFNGETFTGGLGSQGTQMDAIGHFGALPEIWNPFVDPAPLLGTATYYNGFTQDEVKPAPGGEMAVLGIDKAPPIITTAVILDMQDLLGRPMEAGELVTTDLLEDAIDEQIPFRGLLPGDAVFIRTGWGARWVDPEPFPDYYLQGPGLSYQATKFLAESVPVLVGLDNPFTDAFQICELDPENPCPPPDASQPGLLVPAHHSNLVEEGIHQIQNLNLTEIADDDVDIACTMILPLRLRGAAGSPVRPVAVGR